MKILLALAISFIFGFTNYGLSSNPYEYNGEGIVLGSPVQAWLHQQCQEKEFEISKYTIDASKYIIDASESRYHNANPTKDNKQRRSNGFPSIGLFSAFVVKNELDGVGSWGTINCTCVLIAPRYVMTARSCVLNYDIFLDILQNSTFVHFGTDKHARSRLSSVYLHGNLAIVKLENEVPFLPASLVPVTVGQFNWMVCPVMIARWGAGEVQGPTALKSRVLFPREDAKIIANNVTGTSYMQNHLTEGSMGSLVFIKDKNKSLGIGIITEGYPEVLDFGVVEATDIMPHWPWIESVVKGRRKPDFPSYRPIKRNTV